MKRDTTASPWLASSKEQARDTGMAFVLVCLLTALLTPYVREALLAALVLQVLCMTVPQVFKPLARLWFGLSHLLGTVMSKVLLSAVFFIVVTPIGLFRRLTGHDPMKHKDFKRGSSSVFRVRDKTFDAADVAKPY